MVPTTHEWRIPWREHEIVVKTWWTPWLVVCEQLYFDGRLIREQSGWLGTSEPLCGVVKAGGTTHQIQARIGTTWDLKMGCAVLIDRELIGGANALYLR